ncbi:hypothetical protein CKAH01_07497 [Colletotrichum kahawae]|uniref:Uncharacterized protein n=1 Tax=Colletotrichum kahawae TaxID=34407 RepID=A0AAE0D378_COLKA|nr:hypothetical protein CKAH01_07497 [Colletotrichum kahawae]
MQAPTRKATSGARAKSGPGDAEWKAVDHDDEEGTTLAVVRGRKVEVLGPTLLVPGGRSGELLTRSCPRWTSPHTHTGQFAGFLLAPASQILSSSLAPSTLRIFLSLFPSLLLPVPRGGQEEKVRPSDTERGLQLLVGPGLRLQKANGARESALGRQGTAK